MRTKLLSLFLLLSVALAGCTTTSGGSSSAEPGGGSQAPAANFQYFDYDDILIPNDMTQDDDESFFIGTGDEKLGLMYFTGRVEYKSLATTFISNMQNDGWKLVFNFVASPKSVLIFSKSSRFCVAKIFDGRTTTQLSVDVYPVRGSEKVISPVVRPPAPAETSPLKEDALPE